MCHNLAQRGGVGTVGEITSSGIVLCLDSRNQLLEEVVCEEDAAEAVEEGEVEEIEAMDVQIPHLLLQGSPTIRSGVPMDHVGCQDTWRLTVGRSSHS